MGKLAVYKYFSFMFLVITLLLAGFTLFGLLGGHANPARSTAMSMLVYVLPLLIAGDGIMLIYWLIRSRWLWATIPAFTLLCSIPYMGTLYQIRLWGGDDDSQSGIKIASYNVASFGREASGFKAEDILSEMRKHNVDVLCMQEYLDASGNRKNSDSYKSYFTHMATGRKDMVIYSRYPIVRTAPILFEDTNNSAMWADVDVNGRVMRVFNVHMETTGFNRTLHKAEKIRKAQLEIERGASIERNALLKAIYGNYTLGMIVRAHQADTVAKAIRQSDHPVIVCGDFNDVPYSYVYRTLLGDLTDGFKECGKGFMYTFRGKKKVRIDYIFHDSELKGETYYKQELNYSDHYPVFMKIAL